MVRMNLTIQISQEEHDTIDSLHFASIISLVKVHTSEIVGKLLHLICCRAVVANSFSIAA